MTTQAPNHVTAEVDQAQPRKTKDGVRFLVTLGFPFKANKAVALALMEQIGNPLDVDFTMIQPSLESVAQAASVTITGPAQDIRYAEHKTTEDGVEAVVMLPVTDGGRRNRINPHPYKGDPQNAGKCLWCKHGEPYTAHDAARIEQAAQQELAKVKSNGHHAAEPAPLVPGPELVASMEEAGKTPHAFVKCDLPEDDVLLDGCCYVCGQPEESKTHAVEGELPEHMRKTADALIEQASETEAVPSA